MGRKHKTIPRNSGESGEVKKLKDRVRRLDSDKRKLISELKTLQEAFDKTRHFIDDRLDGVPVEKVLKALKDETKLKKIDKDAKESNKSTEKCEQCKRPCILLVNTVSRMIYYCSECKKRFVSTKNDETMEYSDDL